MRHENSEKGGLLVTVRNNDIDKAIRIFKKKVLNDGLLKELKSRSAYEKPSEKRRRQRKEARRRLLKTLSLNKRLAE